MDIMKYFGIYPEDLKQANNICERVFKKYKASDKEMELVFEYANNLFLIHTNDICKDTLTNIIIFCMFCSLQLFVKEKAGDNVSFFVNGSHSNFYINAGKYIDIMDSGDF